MTKTRSTDSLDRIADRLSEDGYPASLASRVRDAQREGRVVWTARHLVITGRDAGEWIPRA